MPRKIAGGILNSSSSLQDCGTQNNQSEIVSTMEQSSSSQAAGQVSIQARKAKEKGRTGEIRRQFYEEKRAKEKIKADGWENKLNTGVIKPLGSLVSDFHKIRDPLRDEFDELIKKFESHEGTASGNQESGLQRHLEQLSLLIKKHDEAIHDFDKKQAELFKKALPDLESFEALPNTDKGNFCRVNDNLKKIVDSAKAHILLCEAEKIYALGWKADMLNHCNYGDYELLKPKYEVLMEETPFADRSGTIHKDVDELIAGYDKVSQASMAVAAEGIEVIKDWDKVFMHPFLMSMDDVVGKRLIVKDAIDARSKNVSSCSIAMASAVHKAHLLIELAMLDGKEQQENENLRKWHALAKSFITQEYAAACSVSNRLMHEECDVAGNVSQPRSLEEVQMRLEAAREGLSQFEKAIRICEKIIEGYEKPGLLSSHDSCSSRCIAPLPLSSETVKF